MTKKVKRTAFFWNRFSL